MADQFDLSYFLRNPDSTGFISLPALWIWGLVFIHLSYAKFSE